MKPPRALPMAPVVTLVCAGPGDPDLLTFKAVRVLRRATVVLVDDLVDGGVLGYLRPATLAEHGRESGGNLISNKCPCFVIENHSLLTVASRANEVCFSPMPIVDASPTPQALPALDELPIGRLAMVQPATPPAAA